MPSRPGRSRQPRIWSKARFSINKTTKWSILLLGFFAEAGAPSASLYSSATGSEPACWATIELAAASTGWQSSSATVHSSNAALDDIDLAARHTPTRQNVPREAATRHVSSGSCELRSAPDLVSGRH
jgi:hypothetical protein